MRTVSERKTALATGLPSFDDLAMLVAEIAAKSHFQEVDAPVHLKPAFQALTDVSAAVRQ